MDTSNHNTIIKHLLIAYVTCYLFRVIEYFWLRTDQTAIGEALFHKIAGIIILLATLHHLKLTKEDIGWQKKHASYFTLVGLLLGIVTFFPAYLTEYLFHSNQQTSLKIFVSAFSIEGNVIKHDGVFFFLICIMGNIINVVMEEGLFRGLFLKLFEQKSTFVKATLLSSLLFGLWHVVGPIRAYIDGQFSLQSSLIISLMQLGVTMLMGIIFCLLVKITGSLWLAMAVHFFNNFIINTLHIVTLTGTDELQVIRISLAQTLLGIVAIIVFIKKKALLQATFR